ncbi:hypothetical protein Ahy_B03g066118 [Arachis hypogaea]|uniref:FH2 domain-containing protein n=1 Tax=Arachis hypogaea TaxID=3818 RepID=A0A445A377_ARAHY|nr:hypothetical protein Ahy_B03g066118 [Arachis hypogaea]
MPNKRFSLSFFSIQIKANSQHLVKFSFPPKLIIPFIPFLEPHESQRLCSLQSSSLIIAKNPRSLPSHHSPPVTTHHSPHRYAAHQLTTHQLTLSSSLNTHKRGKKIRKVENGKKKRRREERERKERTTPARAPPRGPSSLRALTVASASPSRSLTIAAQHHHRVCSLSLLSIVVVAQHRHRRSPEKALNLFQERKVSGKDTKTNETKVKMPLPDMMAAVLAMDESVLDVDQVKNLIKFCPTKEEMELLKGYTGDKENLEKCEQVPRVESKLRVFSFKIQFLSQVTEFKKSLKTVNSACEEDNIEDDDNED